MLLFPRGILLFCDKGSETEYLCTETPLSITCFGSEGHAVHFSHQFSEWITVFLYVNILITHSILHPMLSHKLCSLTLKESFILHIYHCHTQSIHRGKCTYHLLINVWTRILGFWHRRKCVLEWLQMWLRPSHFPWSQQYIPQTRSHQSLCFYDCHDNC